MSPSTRVPSARKNSPDSRHRRWLRSRYSSAASNRPRTSSAPGALSPSSLFQASSSVKSAWVKVAASTSEFERADSTARSDSSTSSSRRSARPRISTTSLSSERISDSSFDFSASMLSSGGPDAVRGRASGPEGTRTRAGRPAPARAAAVGVPAPGPARKRAIPVLQLAGCCSVAVCAAESSEV